MSQQHVCSRCGSSFDSEEKYLGHICKETGFAPVQPEHLGEEFAAISEAALKRGEERQK